MKGFGRGLVFFLFCLVAPAMAYGLDTHEGQGGGQGGGCGDVFGDLIHIKRDSTTGQPILQARLILYPGEEVPREGYCPIPIDEDGNEIPFADLSCEPDPTWALPPIEVDYFGRLSGGRTKERNNRMHFDEVISTIKMAELVTTEETGRLKFGFDCTPNTEDCADWSTVDSPMENLALYTRLMRYGHLQTDPDEVNTWTHGDPAAGTQYHPALDPLVDWPKFSDGLSHLLPGTPDGYGPEALESTDLVRAAAFLGSAANKGGSITVDLVQYMNRILKITQVTGMHASLNPNLLPALIRTCEDPLDADGCTRPADLYFTGGMIPAPADEKFVDFGALSYDRWNWFSKEVEILRPVSATLWEVDPAVNLMDWLAFANGPRGEVTSDIEGFVKASSDALRAVEFVHNYEVPANLWDFVRPRKGDLDGDGDVDRDDIDLILGRNGDEASLIPEYDLDFDGAITPLDAKTALFLCTRKGCQTD